MLSSILDSVTAKMSLSNMGRLSIGGGENRVVVDVCGNFVVAVAVVTSVDTLKRSSFGDGVDLELDSMT